MDLHVHSSEQAAPLGEDSLPQRKDAPAVLLVHGFGAFGEQWRGQVQALTRAGYQVPTVADMLLAHRTSSEDIQTGQAVAVSCGT